MKLLSYLLIVGSLFLSCKKDADKETFYLPEGFSGPVAIIFGQENGVAKEYEDDKRVYRIPQNGVLYTQFPRVQGTLIQEFYYVNSTSERIELPSLFLPTLSTTDLDSSRVYALRGIDGKFGDVKYIYFGVGKATRSDSLMREGYKLMERVREIYPEQVK
jgi:hypothetical protein